MGKMFAGKETPDEEMAEAKALKSGKISKGQYLKGEKSEGENPAKAKKNADAIKSGKMSPKQYASKEEPKKMANGGSVGTPSGVSGTGRRSAVDYGK
jgi:hypothetical protein